MAPLFEPWCAKRTGFKNAGGAIISARIVKKRAALISGRLF